MTQTKIESKVAKPDSKVKNRPNETGTVHVEGFIRIFDPKTKETFVEKRA